MYVCRIGTNTRKQIQILLDLKNTYIYVLCESVSSVAHCIWIGHIFLVIITGTTVLGWGLPSQFPPFRYFLNFSGSPKHTLGIEYHIYIYQVSMQLSCSDTCQIWMWLKESNKYFCKIKNFAYGEISEQSFSNPHTWRPNFISSHFDSFGDWPLVVFIYGGKFSNEQQRLDYLTGYQDSSPSNICLATWPLIGLQYNDWYHAAVLLKQMHFLDSTCFHF